MALSVSARRGCANFTSDNTAGCMPEVMRALQREAAKGSAPAYGNDRLSSGLEAVFTDIFEHECTVFPVTTGTAANGLALSAFCKPYSAVFCHVDSHINCDEAGAPEFFTNGAKLVTIEGPDAKFTAESLAAKVDSATLYGDYGGVPAAVSVTQVNEAGLLYSLAELRAIGEVARCKGIAYHMDGARFANAVMALGCSPAELTWQLGVDVLSFGCTKNGCMAAEAVVFFQPRQELARDFRLRQKRGGHLWSKMRFISAQLHGYLADDAWRRGAQRGNQHAQRLGAGLQAVCLDLPALGGAVALARPVAANEVFFTLPEVVLRGVFEDGHACLDIGALTGKMRPGELLRCVTCWATTEQEVDGFLRSVRTHAARFAAAGIAKL